MSELSNGAFNSYLREKKQEEDIAAGGGGGTPTLEQVLGQDNSTDDHAIKIGGSDQAFLLNAPGLPIISSDANNGLQLNDAGGIPSANFNDRKLLNANGDITLDWNNAALPYTVYTALLNQSGTDAPVATVLQNTLGYNPLNNLQYNGAGYYLNSSIFPDDPAKTVLFLQSTYSNDNQSRVMGIKLRENEPSEYNLFITTTESGQNTDGLLSNTAIEIRVYP